MNAQKQKTTPPTNRMKRPVSYGVAMVLGALLAWCGIALAAPSSRPLGNITNWKNQPKHTFTKGAKHFAQVMKLLRTKHLNPKLDEATLYKAAIKGMMEFGDPKEARWNKLLSPTELAEMRASLHSRIAGIGIMMKFDAKSGTTEVLGIIPKSPAQAAGLRKGDRILKVNGKFYKGKNIRDVVYAIRGKIGTKLVLTVLRDTQIFTKTLTRKKVKYRPLHGWILPGNIGLIKIHYFAYATPKLLAQELTKMAAKKVKGLIIDLRTNSGGALKSALASADMLLPKGKIIAKLRQRGGKVKLFVAKTADLLPGLATRAHILINGKTSSGAELFAAAMKVHKKARLLGSKTFGKWNVQKIAKLENGYALKYTIGQFQDPNGAHYHRKGLSPDIHVPSDKSGKSHDHHRPIEDVSKRLKTDATLRIAYSMIVGK